MKSQRPSHETTTTRRGLVLAKNAHTLRAMHRDGRGGAEVKKKVPIDTVLHSALDDTNQTKKKKKSALQRWRRLTLWRIRGGGGGAKLSTTTYSLRDLLNP